MRKLAIVVTHPIQYYVPLFQLLSKHQNLELKVFYTWGEQSVQKFDPGFQKEIEWDIPLLAGYEYEFLKNTANIPGSNHFMGIINPDSIVRIKSYKPDAILIYGWSYYSHLKILRYFRNKTTIYFRGDSTLLDSSPKWKYFIRKRLLSWVYKHVNQAFYVGTANKKYFLEFGLKEDQLQFAPHAIDIERFSVDRTHEANLLRGSLGIKKEQILILFAGKLEEKKNPFLLLHAFETITDLNVLLLFVGDGCCKNLLKERAHRSFKKDKILFLDFQNQTFMPVIYQACQLFCLPSKGPGETWGLAVNEAMASHKAILVSNKVGCSEDLIKDGLNGSTFMSNDSTDLSKKIQNLISNPASLLEMGKRSGEIIADWSYKNQIKSYTEAIRKIEKK